MVLGSKINVHVQPHFLFWLGSLKELRELEGLFLPQELLTVCSIYLSFFF